MGTLIGDDADQFNPFTLTFCAPNEDGDSESPTTKGGITIDHLAGIIWEVVMAAPDTTVGSVRQLYAQMRVAGHPFRDQSIRAAADVLVAQGRLTELPGKRGATGYQAIRLRPSESVA